MSLLSEFDRRGLIHDSTDRQRLEQRLVETSIGVYVGFDPTADSLHVGHLLGQISLRRFQLAGHRPVALAGGATGMVGDPGGRSEERNLLDADTLSHNVECISRQLHRLIDFEPGPYQATLVNNASWTTPMGVIEFLRDVGKFATVNQMIAKDSVRSRLEGEHGISFTEFSYMLLQANDFYYLHQHLGVDLQMGGSDQWGNIVSGVDLIRRRLGEQAHGLTWPLLLKADGSKFGKTAAGAVWLDPEKTSPYQFRQFWMQTDDEAIGSLLRRFSLAPLAELEAVLATHAEAPHLRAAQRFLADEMTELVHGPEAARSAIDIADLLFGGDPTDASAETLVAVGREIPAAQVTRAALSDLADVLAATGVTASKSEARRLLEQGGIRVNGVVVGGDEADLVPLHGRYLLVRRGKTAYHLLEIAG
jgi:tyrosyl-tRNA synthetase